MVLYWPMAKAGEDGETKLFTYDAALTLQKALDQFTIWERDYHYHITEAWIQVTEDGKEARLDVERVWRVKERSKACSTDTE